MNRSEPLLACLAEECCEVGQRVSKAVRFGLAEVQRDQPLNNAERVVEELRDLFAVTAILIEEGIIPPFEFAWRPDVEAKRAKIERYMAISRETGALVQTVAS
jgi:NTP pyrophosphatase (non-canonical NTP hydrolase)